ncbi:rhodanese-like domain-containing protein [Lysinibacillus sphaericus]|uniref:Rhodanese-like domain-containing protein n=1 Tax=Lysinibacillus sphaericus TaxID=1421 RepID=A0A544UL70_LYSSH|nr:rhodanese-like domain-containing protein [Lysinibacillus sp. SDF0037]TQR34233.1 rhodanese-like domain-containing protein [Lysinibacillus sp. SDF0037]
MKEISTKEVQQALEQGQAIKLIDVREVESGHIPGMIHIPLDLLEFRMHELNKNESYVIVCRSGGRSGRATQFLESQGFDVSNMVGGMLAWDGEVQ